MAKKVQLPPEERMAFGLDEIEDIDLDFAVDSYSEDGGSQRSADVSDHEDNIKAAPRRVYIGADRCRKLFQLANDTDTGMIRVCGGPDDCRRAGHKAMADRGEMGTYETIMTTKYIDGRQDTYLSREDEDQWIAKQKAIKLDAMTRLTGLRAYQKQLQDAEAEFGTHEEGDDNGTVYGSTDDGGDLGDHWNVGDEQGGGDSKTCDRPAKEAGRQQRQTRSTTGKTTPSQGNAKVTEESSPASTVTRSNPRTKKARGQTRPPAKETAEPQGTADDTRAMMEDIQKSLKLLTTAVIAMAKTADPPGQPEKAPSEDATDDTDDDSEREEDKKPSAKSRGGNRQPEAPNKNKWYYAVAKGRVPGVYTDWGKAERQVNGFSGAVHKKFRDRKRAERFVKENRRLEGDSEDSEDVTASEAEDPSEGEDHKPSSKARSARKGKVITNQRVTDPEMPPLEITAPDPSLGNNKELFKMSLADDRTMTAKMSPPGLDGRTMKELADATLDAIQLPGTSNSEATDNTTDLIGALKEIAEDKRTDWSEDRPRRDVQWRANNRTSLLSIKTQAGLQERHGSFQGLAEEMFETQVHLFEAVLGRLHWSPAMVRAWSQSNWFLRIGKDTLDHYMALHLHLVTLSNTEGWDYAQESLKHHGNKLAEIRKLAPSRLLCIVKTYIYLREARKVDFYSPKLQEKRNKAMLAKITTLEGGGGPECPLRESFPAKSVEAKGMREE
jgi:hypothetical protein